jgi:hypothetical protein
MTESAQSPSMPVRRSRFRSVKLLLLSAIIFLCGAAAGWGARMLWFRPPPLSMMGMGPEPPVKDMVARLKEELLLSDDQAQKVDDIYRQRADALDKIRQTMGPQLRSEYDQLNEQMKSVLNPEQFHLWHERFENLRNRMLPPPPGRPPATPGRPPPPPGAPPFGGPGGIGPGGMGPDGMGPGGPRPPGGGPPPPG